MSTIETTNAETTETVASNGVTLATGKPRKAARAARKAAPKAEIAPKAAKGRPAVPPLETRGSSVAQFYASVLNAFNSANGNTVTNVAAALKIGERQVRGVIDKARSTHGYGCVERVGPSRFRWNGVPKAPKKAKA